MVTGEAMRKGYAVAQHRCPIRFNEEISGSDACCTASAMFIHPQHTHTHTHVTDTHTHTHTHTRHRHRHTHTHTHTHTHHARHPTLAPLALTSEISLVRCLASLAGFAPRPDADVDAVDDARDRLRRGGVAETPSTLVTVEVVASGRPNGVVRRTVGGRRRRRRDVASGRPSKA